MVENHSSNQQDMNLNFDNFYTESPKYWSVFTGVKIGLFEFLNCEDYKSLKEIKEGLDLKIKERNLLDFLDVLFVNGSLVRDGKGLNSKYKNKDFKYVKSNPKNQLHDVIFMEWETRKIMSLDTILKTGEQNQNLFENVYSNQELSEGFMKVMGCLQNDKFELITDKIDFSKYKTVLDVGGCLGNFLVKLKSKNQHLICTNFDLGKVKPNFEKFTKENCMENQINFIEANFFEDEIPQSDVIVMGNILHDWGLDVKLMLMNKANRSLNENGIFIIIEDFVSENRDNYYEGLFNSYTMLTSCVNGYEMTREEVIENANKTGFLKVEFLKEKIGCDGAILYK